MEGKLRLGSANTPQGCSLDRQGKCRGFTVAIKLPNKKLTPDQVEEFKAEIRIMSKLFNPRIALFMGAYIPEDPNEHMAIVSEVLHGDMVSCMLFTWHRLLIPFPICRK